MNSAPLRKVSIFAHHRSGTSGVCDFLEEYLQKQPGCEIAYVRFPFLESADGAISVDVNRGGSRQERKKSLIRFYRPEPISYLKDFVFALIYGVRHARGSDLYIGTTNLLALAGVLLRATGFVRRSVYLMIDYTPRRYSNGLLNWLYYRVDRLAAHGCDRVWTLSEAMIDGRFKDGRLSREKVRYSVVPFGNHSDQYEPEDLEAYDPDRIVYFGGVLKSKGAELFAPILDALAKAGNPRARLLCMGAGDLEFLREEASRHGVLDRMEILGPVDDHEEVERRLLSCALAIAPYDPRDKNSFSFFADPGKVKTYLGCALPVVITDVPPIARDIERAGAGAIAGYDAKEFAAKITEILGTLRQSRTRAFEMGKKFSWTGIFRQALGETL